MNRPATERVSLRGAASTRLRTALAELKAELADTDRPRHASEPRRARQRLLKLTEQLAEALAEEMTS